MPGKVTLEGGPGMNALERPMEEVITEERLRLRDFIRRRVPNEADAEELLQDVFYELARAYRLLTPIDSMAGWLFGVARNRITDLFRKKRPLNFTDVAGVNEDGEPLSIEDMLSSLEYGRDSGPETLYFRGRLLDALDTALRELPVEQREVFLGHEWEGRSFQEMAAESDVNVNTLLSRKRYAVLHLRKRLQAIHDEF
jgi:RNA polymerase sigma factor (sigma-70 family)